VETARWRRRPASPSWATPRVALSYRGDAFQRAKQRNRQRVDEASKKGQLKVLLNSQVREIRAEEVVLKLADKELKLRNDAVIVSAGGILRTDFLKSIGIRSKRNGVLNDAH